MKVLRNPRLNRTVVSVAVDTAASLVRAFSLRDMIGSLWERTAGAPPRQSCKHLTRFVYGPIHLNRSRPVRKQMLAAFAALALTVPACAQEWPQRQVTIVVPFTAGG